VERAAAEEAVAVGYGRDEFCFGTHQQDCSYHSDSELSEDEEERVMGRSPYRKSVRSLPDNVRELSLPCLDSSEAPVHPHTPFLCYLKLPRDVANYRISAGSDSTVLNTFDFLRARENIHSIRHSENIDFTKFLKAFYREYNFSSPDKYSNPDGHHMLRFSSLYPGGNLLAVIKVSSCHQSVRRPNTYFLEMSPDTNSSASDPTGYFNFSFTGGIRGQTYTFHICNIKTGLKEALQRLHPSCFSSKAWKKEKTGWCRTKGSYEFSKNEDASEVLAPHQLFEASIRDRYRDCWTLSFAVTVKYKKDKLLLSSNIPYGQAELARDFVHFQNLSTAHSASRMYARFTQIHEEEAALLFAAEQEGALLRHGSASLCTQVRQQQSRRAHLQEQTLGKQQLLHPLGSDGDLGLGRALRQLPARLLHARCGPDPQPRRTHRGQLLEDCLRPPAGIARR